ncbi:alpha/beta hydrolase [Winogradskyella forsetii]|uniref:alpha/beta hydrolase n=1 Tax=Winogradskyella forsetii TaxID=2686077 RepID=UPI0015B8151B|nr:alpha/beta hydrolase fold domain-containing protein [Winogradskyella forsetii]
MRFTILFGLFFVCNVAFAFQKTVYKTQKNIPYYQQTDSVTAYQKEKNVLNIHYPEGNKDVPVIIWFHGGGLTSGDHTIPEALKETNNVIVSVDYRLSPTVKPETCIDDAVLAIAWVFQHIKDYNGDSDNIFVAGHSAGGYLALMSVMDASRLEALGVDANKIAGLIPFSGHTITHFEIRKQNNIKAEQPIIDRLAPLYYVRKDAPPILLITGDREKELLGRYEENAYFCRMMKVAGNEDIQLLELDGYGHLMAAPAFPLLLEFVKNKSADNK